MPRAAWLKHGKHRNRTIIKIKMKNWALMVAALYLLILVVLTVPAIMLAFGPSTGLNGLKTAASAYLDLQYWVWLMVMFAGQLALLSIPVRVASLRPVSRGPVWW